MKILINIILVETARIIYKLISIPLCLLPIIDNRIFISNYYGKGYGDNLKYINEEILNRSDNYEVIWSVDKLGSYSFPHNVREVKRHSFKEMILMCTSKIWIDNCRKVLIPHKRKSQKYIQTWHASMGIKKIEGDAISKLPKTYIKSAKIDSENCDYILSGSDFRTDVYQRAFWYSGIICKFGTPRTDIYFNESKTIKIKIRDYFNLKPNSTILLYAPTFRDYGNFDFSSFPYENVLKKLIKNHGENTYIMIRLHPNVSNQRMGFDFSEQIIDATDYPDMQELLVASDFLITDYSSVMFDMLILNKPCVLFTPDLEKYESSRNTYFEFNQLPFKIFKETDSLLHALDKLDMEDYVQLYDGFLEKIGNYEEGTASKRTVDLINNIVEGKIYE